MAKYNSDRIKYSLKIDDQKTFDKNNSTIALKAGLSPSREKTFVSMIAIQN